jgi:hypothetical protein
MLRGYDAQYRISQFGEITVSVRSSQPTKFRAIYVGSANLEFNWVLTGMITTWKFNPSLLDPKPAEFTQTASEDGVGQIVSVVLGKEDEMPPTAGFLRPAISGAIRTPGIHFETSHAHDIWVFLLRSLSQAPLKLEFEKTSLTITHGSAQARALISSSTDADGRELLKAEATTSGEGFHKVYLSIRRTLGEFSTDETIGEVGTEMRTFTWKPVLRSFDALLVTSSAMSIYEFLEFLKSLGAGTTKGGISLSLSGVYMLNDFFLCDGPTVDYTLRLTGERHILGHVHDESKMFLNA